MQEENRVFDVIVIGGGPAGIMASISAAKENKSVLLLEKLPKIAAKLKATGGGKCNLTNTLSSDEFIAKFGKNSRFITYAIEAFDAKDLRDFFTSINVETIARDGFRVFPVEHNSSVILNALDEELERLGVEVKCSVSIENIEKKGLEENNVIEVIGKTIKAIRNGIVHSSDKYNRADRFIPFSESEDIVKKYLPIVKFLAEKIIATTSH